MPQYVLALDAHAMDHIPDEDMPDVDKAAHAVSQEAIDAGVWVCGSGLDDQRASIVAADRTVTEGLPPQGADERTRPSSAARRTTAARRERLLAGLRSIGGSWPNALGRAYRRARQWPDDHRAAPVEVLARLRALVPR